MTHVQCVVDFFQFQRRIKTEFILMYVLFSKWFRCRNSDTRSRYSQHIIVWTLRLHCVAAIGIYQHITNSSWIAFRAKRIAKVKHISMRHRNGLLWATLDQTMLNNDKKHRPWSGKCFIYTSFFFFYPSVLVSSENNSWGT